MLWGRRMAALGSTVSCPVLSCDALTLEPLPRRRCVLCVCVTLLLYDFNLSRPGEGETLASKASDRFSSYQSSATKAASEVQAKVRSALDD